MGQQPVSAAGLSRQTEGVFLTEICRAPDKFCIAAISAMTA